MAGNHEKVILVNKLVVNQLDLYFNEGNKVVFPTEGSFVHSMIIHSFIKYKEVR